MMHCDADAKRDVHVGIVVHLKSQTAALTHFTAMFDAAAADSRWHTGFTTNKICHPLYCKSCSMHHLLCLTCPNFAVLCTIVNNDQLCMLDSVHSAHLKEAVEKGRLPVFKHDVANMDLEIP